jgi:hypothetical protein
VEVVGNGGERLGFALDDGLHSAPGFGGERRERAYLYLLMGGTYTFLFQIAITVDG